MNNNHEITVTAHGLRRDGKLFFVFVPVEGDLVVIKSGFAHNGRFDCREGVITIGLGSELMTKEDARAVYAAFMNDSAVTPCSLKARCWESDYRNGFRRIYTERQAEKAA